MNDELEQAKQSFIKKALENMNEALLAKKYFDKIKNLITTKKIITITDIQKKIDLNETEVLTIFEELVLYNVVSGKIEEKKLIID